MKSNLTKTFIAAVLCTIAFITLIYQAGKLGPQSTPNTNNTAVKENKNSF